MSPLDIMTLEELVRLWANEALRLFHDRLVTAEEQEWCQEQVGAMFVNEKLVLLVSLANFRVSRRLHVLASIKGPSFQTA